MDSAFPFPSREQLLHSLYEAAELEHNLMCTYLYAAFSLKRGQEEGLSAPQAEAVERWRRAIMDIAIDEMGHLVAVWNISAALGGSPRFGRGNFPLEPGFLPAGVVVKLAPFGPNVLQHFIHLERPEGSSEPEGEGFSPVRRFRRGVDTPRLTPMPLDYETVGAFYATLSGNLSALVARVGEAAAFCGDPALQLSPDEIELGGAKPVLCAKTALAAFTAIVEQGEGAPEHSEDSHFRRFVSVREELAALSAQDPSFAPAFPAAVNPVLRRPPTPEGRVWIEDEEATTTVDIANSAYGLMLRLLAYSYSIPRPHPEKALAVDLSLELMRAFGVLGEHAARLPAGPSNPDCNAGVSFTALRDSAPLHVGASARRFFAERLTELASGAAALAAHGAQRPQIAARLLAAAAKRAAQFETLPAPAAPGAAPTRISAPNAAESTTKEGVEIVEAPDFTLLYEAKRCIHTRFCVTGAPKVFLANVQGPWLHPEEMGAEELAGVARECPSGAIKYRRKDGHADEAAPAVNLVRVYENGPNAFRADMRIDGEPIGYRATLCRCGASKNKPFCDGSHKTIGFEATGEPPTGEKTEMLAMRDGPLEINPQTDGPLMVRGNLEIMAGTGRMVARVTACRLCRCGHSQNKPFCDGSHAKVGFKSG